jgi:hypothetical protein
MLAAASAAIALSILALLPGAGCEPARPVAITNAGSETISERVQLADQALAELVRPDFRRPFESGDIHYARVRAMYLDACRGGDRRSCWMVPQLRDPDVGDRDASADQMIARNCRAGDVMSCRALPWDFELPDALGAIERSKMCGDRRPQCDLRGLEEECVHGFSRSCELASSVVSSKTEARALRKRFVELAQDGCQQGLLDECEWLRNANFGDELGAVMVAWKRLCLITGNYCDHAEYLSTEPIIMRDLLEHQCQMSPTMYRHGRCTELLEKYAKHVFPEPVPGRFDQLRDWYCREAPALDHPELCQGRQQAPPP